jgi:hypothetical protein
MKKFHRLLLLALILASIAIPSASFAAQTVINLGASSTFAILAGTTITNTGRTEISGSAGRNLGTYPGIDRARPSDIAVSESVSFSNTDAKVAHEDLVTAYNDAAGRSPAIRIPTELGGKTLTPGVYDSASGTFELTGTLILDGQGDPDGVFIFLTEKTLVTAANSRVDTIGTARYGHIFWIVGSSTTLEINSKFAGHVLALNSIEAKKGAEIQGQLLAQNGEVILNNNKITNGLSISTQTSAVIGGEVQQAKASWYNLLMFGVVIAIAITGIVIWFRRRRNLGRPLKYDS